MVVLATLGGWLISARKPVEKPVRILLLVLYFWVLMFVQIVLFSLGYLLLKA